MNAEELTAVLSEPATRDAIKSAIENAPDSPTDDDWGNEADAVIAVVAAALASTVYMHASDCSWAIGASDECSCGLDNLLLLAREQ